MKKRFEITTLLTLIVVVFWIIICFGIPVFRAFDKVNHMRTMIVEVTDKNIKRHGSQDKYLIYTKNDSGIVEVCEITDNVLSGRFNSADLYGLIEIGKTYEFTVGGSRNHFLSWYPNIYGVEEIIESKE